MNQHNKGSHTVYDIKYHVIWVTKYRYKVPQKTDSFKIKMANSARSRSKRVTIVRGSIEKYPVHILIECSPNIAPSKIIQYLKGRSSRLIQDEFPELKKNTGAAFMGKRIFLCNGWQCYRRNY